MDEKVAIPNALEKFPQGGSQSPGQLGKGLHGPTVLVAPNEQQLTCILQRVQTKHCDR